MNQYVTGAVIKELREKNKMTQLALAEKLGVSDKTISKWETGKGYPDITLLEPISKAFSISVTELISGNTIHNENVSANMLRSKFYVCPVCGNVIHGMGEAAIHCHGIQLMPLEAEPTDERHMVFIERVEDEYYVRIDHSMTKEHYISFVAAASSDDMQLVKLYPEGNAEARFKIRDVRKIYLYCNRDGLFSIAPVKGIDDKESGFDFASKFGIRYHDLPEDADSSFFLCKELIPGYLHDVTGVYQTPQGYYVKDEDVDEFDKEFPPKEKLKLPGQIFG